MHHTTAITDSYASLLDDRVRLRGTFSIRLQFITSHLLYRTLWHFQRTFGLSEAKLASVPFQYKHDFAIVQVLAKIRMKFFIATC